MPRKKDSIIEFFAGYPTTVNELATSIRSLIRSAIPDASETLDEPDRVVGYGIGSGYTGLVCTIIPSKTGVKLGIPRSAGMSDPHGLLQGTGKRHRYVQFTQPKDIDRAGIKSCWRPPATQ